MRVLYVSKAMTVAAYRGKLDALRAHCDVQLLAPHRWGAQPYEAAARDTFPVRRAHAWLNGHNHLHLYRRAATTLRDAAPTLVHIDEEPYSAVTGQLVHACSSAGIPCVFFAWQNIDKRIPQPFRAIRRYVFTRAQGGIAGTESAATVLRSSGCALPIAVIPQIGIDPCVFRPDPELRRRARSDAGIPGDAAVVAFAGRLVPAKGVSLLIEALAPVRDVWLLVVGSGPEQARLKQLAAATLPDRHRFVGHVASMDMPGWVQAADVLVLPSLRTPGWQEQFGRVLVEAMACGIPVIGSDTGEIPRVIGDAGVVVRERDVPALTRAIERLIASPELRGELGARARQRVLESWTHERIAAATADFYRELLEAA